MNLSTKCNCCACEPVCKYKTVYEKGVEAILNATIPTGESANGSFSFFHSKRLPTYFSKHKVSTYDYEKRGGSEMKIPESVRIGGVEYPIVYVENLNNGVQLAYGHIDYENCKIELSNNVGTAHEKRCVTLWHEILHGIRNHAGLEIENEEVIVDMFAKGIYQVLQDNGLRLFDIELKVVHSNDR